MGKYHLTFISFTYNKKTIGQGEQTRSLSKVILSYNTKNVVLTCISRFCSKLLSLLVSISTCYILEYQYILELSSFYITSTSYLATFPKYIYIKKKKNKRTKYWYTSLRKLKHLLFLLLIRIYISFFIDRLWKKEINFIRLASTNPWNSLSIYYIILWYV